MLWAQFSPSPPRVESQELSLARAGAWSWSLAPALGVPVDLSDGWWAPSPVILSWPQVSHIKRCSASSLPGSWGPRPPRRQPCEDSWALAGAPPGQEIPSATVTLAEAGFPMLHGTSLGSLFLCSQTASQPNQRSIWTFWIGCPPDLGLASDPASSSPRPQDAPEASEPVGWDGAWDQVLASDPAFSELC